MENLKSILIKSNSFSFRYILEYLKLLIKPCLIAIFGFIFLTLSFLNPIFAVFALFITIPCLCISFWQGFCITYILNCAALNFKKGQGCLSLADYLNVIKGNKDFIKYISFCAFFTLICFSPSVYLIFKNLNSIISLETTNYFVIITKFIGLFIFSVINGLILVPFTNFFTQAYLFKKDNESYFDLFINCYKYLNKDGLIIAYGITILVLLLTTINVIFLPLAIILNLYIYSINTFWYASRLAETP